MKAFWKALASYSGLFTSTDQSGNYMLLREQFHSHMGQFGLNYPTKEEYEFRFGLFKHMDGVINEWNGN